MLGVLYESHICFRVHVDTFGKRVPKDRDYQEPTSQFERPVGRGDIATYLVQIVNKPDQIVLLKVLHTSFILSPVKCLVEPIAELR